MRHVYRDCPISPHLHAQRSRRGLLRRRHSDRVAKVAMGWRSRVLESNSRSRCDPQKRSEIRIDENR
jgi:hypothetical protein